MVFHERYYSTLVASTNPTIPTQEDNAPQQETQGLQEQPKQAEQPATPEEQAEAEEQTTTIDPIVVDTNDQELQAIYDIIRENIPDLDRRSLSADAQQFLDIYGLEITHKLSPKTTVRDDVQVELYIYNKATQEPFTGTLPVEITLVAANQNVRVLPSTIDYAHNGTVMIRLRGSQPGPSIIGFTIDDSIFYALPVLVE
jgi:hypothetical protein